MCVTVFEIVLPVLFAVILVCIRLIAKNETITDKTIWPPFQPTQVGLEGMKNRILYSPNTTEVKNLINTFRNHLPNASSLGISFNVIDSHFYQINFTL